MRFFLTDAQFPTDVNVYHVTADFFQKCFYHHQNCVPISKNETLIDSNSRSCFLQLLCSSDICPVSYFYVAALISRWCSYRIHTAVMAPIKTTCRAWVLWWGWG